MNRQRARRIHEVVNLSYWVENPDWNSTPLITLGCKAVRALPFSIYDLQKKIFFKSEGLIAVNGESVVVANGIDKVDKFMFRYPVSMSLGFFKEAVSNEVKTVTNGLAGIALPTNVAIKPADIFKRGEPLPTVAQTQQLLDLDIHPPLDMQKLVDKPKVRRDKTARDLAALLQCAEILRAEDDFFVDVVYGSGNLRASEIDGALTLIDVMPVYADGSRLIGDAPRDIIEHIQNTTAQFQDFVGQYGA